MKTVFGAVVGALTVGAMLVSYNLGERQALSRDLGASTVQLVVGPDGIARPYLLPAGQNMLGQPLVGQPYGWTPQGPAVQVPAAGYSYATYQPGPYVVPTQGSVTERVVERPVVRRVSSDRVVTERR